MTDGCFDTYTDNEYYYDRTTKQNDETKELKKYPEYFKKNFSNSITNPDEWILGFIPEELFINKGQYFYMGREYGFFVDNNGSEQLAFIFDSTINVNKSGDGYIEQKFSPLFYHTYKYSNGQVRIKSYEEKDRYFVKDVMFGAALGNLTYANKEDSHYDAELDDGAFFISTNYHYDGTSLQSGLAEDGINTFTTVVSGALKLGGLICPPLLVVSEAFDGFKKVLDVIDVIDSFIEMNDNVARDYRESLSNGEYIGELYHTNKDAQLHGTSEHPAYSDGLRKLAIGKMETSMDNPVLLDMGNVHNVECLYTIGTTSHWSTNFVGRIGLDIVKEKSVFDGTKIENAYENIVSSCFSVRTWEADEKPQNFECDKDYYIDIAPNTTKQIKVKSEYSSDYTINAGGELFSVYDANNNVIASNKDELTIFMDKDTEFRVEISSANSAIHANGGFYCTPKKLSVNGNENFVLQPSKNHIFSYENDAAQSLCFDLNNADLEIGIYDASGKELAYSSGKNLNYLYNAESEIFVVVYNHSITSQNAILSLTLQKTIKANESFEYSILANETKYYVFDYFARGNYEILCNESVDVEIINIYGQSVDIIENSVPYFIKVTNKNGYEISGNICLKFSPLTVLFGKNNLSNNPEYVQFSPLSTQFYTFNGVAKVYDYYFNLINLSNNQAELLKDNTYYLLSNSTALTISVNSSELPINQNSINRTDVNGVAYFKLNISIPTNYKVNFSAISAEIYNDNFKFIENLYNNSELALNTGCYYIKVTSSANSNVAIQIQLIGTELVIESQNIIHNNSINYYLFNPRYSEGYKFYTIGDLNNSLTSKITIYKNTNSGIEKISETTIGKYVELSINLQKADTIIIAVELNNANGQAAIFTVEYINGGHNSEIEDSFGIVESNSIQSIVKKGESKLFRFTPTISGKFDYYIEKSLSNTFNVQMFTETSTAGQNLTIYEQLNDSKVYKYKVTLTKGTNYYFVITYKNGLSLDDVVTVTINREFSNVLLKTYITGTTSYYYGNPIKIAPCMSYDIALFDNDILLDDSLSLRYSVNNSAVKLNNNNIIVTGTSSIGQLITVSTTYFYTNYTLNLKVENPFNGAKIGIDVGRNSEFMYPNLTFTTIDNGILMQNISPKIEYKFKMNDSAVYTLSSSLRENSKLYTNSYNLMNYWDKEFNKIAFKITYNLNSYSFEYNANYSYDNTFIDLANYTDTKIAQRESAYITGATTNTTYNKKLNIGSNVKILTLSGTQGKYYYSLNIEIQQRNTPLLIYMRDFQFTGANSTVAINSYSSNSVCIYCLGTVTINGGSGESGYHNKDNSYNSSTSTYINGGNGGNGGHGAEAIKAYNLDIFAANSANVTIRGGSGGYGGDGYYGKDGINGNNGSNGGTYSQACGKNGTIGGNGGRGGDGGNGAVAIKVSNRLYFSGINNATINVYAGFGGDGGNGGDGGDGGNGGNGAETAKRSDRNDAGAGGAGGAGGHGGAGGNAGNGTYAISSSTASASVVKLILYSSYGGSSGSAGYGGKGGNGGVGGADTRISGREGDGGNGGRGGNGANAGNNGISGGNSTISGSTVTQKAVTYPYPGWFGGYYSYGGNGGSGGAHGDTGAKDDKASNGTNGSKGADGTSGRRPQSVPGGGIS